MRTFLYFLGLGLGMIIPATAQTPAMPQTAAAVPQVAVIPINGDIEPAVLVFLERAIAEAQTKPLQGIIFKINTFGGRLDTAYDIVQLLSSLNHAELSSIALVEDKAISAGTLIALSCHELYMMPGSTLGDVAPVAMGGEEGVTMLGEKFQSPLRAKFRALAEQNNYPVKLTEAFVSAERAIYLVTYQDGSSAYLNNIEYDDLSPDELQNIVKKKTIVAKGELLTMNEQEALTLGFSRATVSNMDELLALRFPNATLSEYQTKTSEKASALIARYAGILIFIALTALYLEAQSPGFGIFGSAALLTFAVLFAGLFAVELATYGELALLISGIMLIALEVFIFSGTLISGVLGVVCVLGALLLMLQDFTLPQTSFESELLRENLITISIAFIAGTVMFFFSFAILKNWRRSNPLVLNATLHQGTALPASSPATSIAVNPGTIGTALSDLRPSGKVTIGGNVHDAITDGNYIKQGDNIIVEGSHGASLLVGIQR